MTDITNELMYEQLKAIRADLGEAKLERREIRDEVRALKGMVAALVQSDLNRDSELARLIVE